MEKKHIDATLVFLILALVIFGLIMMSSVSVYSSNTVTERMVALGKLDKGNNYFYLQRHLMYVVIGILALAITSKIPYTFLEQNAKRIFAGTLILLVAVLFVGEEYNGAR